MMTSVEVEGEYVVITRLRIDDGQSTVAVLSFAEVAQASKVLREHLLSVLPVEEPYPLEDDPPMRRPAVVRRGSW